MPFASFSIILLNISSIKYCIHCNEKYCHLPSARKSVQIDLNLVDEAVQDYFVSAFNFGFECFGLGNEFLANDLPVFEIFDFVGLQFGHQTFVFPPNLKMTQNSRGKKKPSSDGTPRNSPWKQTRAIPASAIGKMTRTAR
jgi:hypothetical protein